MKLHATYFPMGDDWKIFNENHKLIAEGFNSKSEANEYIAKNSNEKLYDIYVIWNRSFNWSHYGTYLGEEGLEKYKKEILYQGDGARVKKVKSELREL